jgi:pantetheine-phosphate adenylyltransferase
LIVAVYDRPLKNLFFSPEERIALTKESFEENPRIKVFGYNNLTVEFCREMDAHVIVRGLRVFSDFEYEFRMALANHRLDKDIDVVALITSEEHTFLSSTTVREIASLHGDVSTMVPPHVREALMKRMEEISESSRIQYTSLKD